MVKVGWYKPVMTDTAAPIANTAPAALVRALEERAFNAWPAHQTVFHRGWVFRLSGGYTKRANSVNALVPGAPFDGVREAAAALYARHGLPAVFRISPRPRPRPTRSWQTRATSISTPRWSCTGRWRRARCPGPTAAPRSATRHRPRGWKVLRRPTAWRRTTATCTAASSTPSPTRWAMRCNTTPRATPWALAWRCWSAARWACTTWLWRLNTGAADAGARWCRRCCTGHGGRCNQRLPAGAGAEHACAATV